MKKQLIAAAVASVIASPILAQNVTVYGVMDLNMQSHKQDAATGGVTRQTGAGSYASTQIGFKGVEDLGGGLKVSFELRDEFDASDPAALQFGQESHVAIEGGFGKLRFGLTDITPVQAFDGSSWAGQFGNLTNNPAVTSTGATNALVELGKDVGNSIAYTSPDFNGLQFHVGHATGQTATGVQDANAAVNSYALTYKSGPFMVAVGSSSKEGSAGAAQKHDAFAASYDFKVAKIGLSYGVFEASTAVDTQDTKVTILSASVPLGGPLTLRGGYMTGKVDGDTASNEAKGYVVGGTYDLSKRTLVYAAYAKVTNEINGKWGWAGTTAPTTAGSDPGALTIGISHNF